MIFAAFSLIEKGIEGGRTMIIKCELPKTAPIF